MILTEPIAESTPASYEFSPDRSNMRLALTAREIAAAQLAASQAKVHLEILEDPRAAAAAYIDFARKSNHHASMAQPTIHFGLNEQLCGERAQEVISAGGALLVLVNPNGNGFAEFNDLYKNAKHL